MSTIQSIERQFGKHLLNFIKSRVYSIADAEDIYQDVLIKIISNVDSMNKPESVKSWLFSIARNKIIDYYRQQQKRVQEDLDELVNSSIDLNEQNNPYESLEGCLIHLIEQLPKEYRSIIFASEIEKRSQKELAENLNINYITLRSKIQRGRKKLKEIIYNNCIIEQDISGGLASCTPINSTKCCDGSGSCQ